MDNNDLKGIKDVEIKIVNSSGKQIKTEKHDVPFYNVEVCSLYELIPQIINQGIYKVENAKY